MTGEETVRYLAHYIGRPYIWAGNGSQETYEGFDCSGLVLEGLWAAGAYTGDDTSANGLRLHAISEKWQKVKTAEAKPGDVCFFGTTKTTHVGMICDAAGLCMIEAGGGSSACTSLATSTGSVRIRPVSRRKDLQGIWRPNYK